MALTDKASLPGDASGGSGVGSGGSASGSGGSGSAGSRSASGGSGSGSGGSGSGASASGGSGVGSGGSASAGSGGVGAFGVGSAGLVGLLDEFFAGVDAVGEVEALRAVEVCRRRCDAVEARLLAGRVDAVTGDVRAAGVVLGSVGGTSKRERSRRLRRAKLVAEQPRLADRVESGEASSEILDLLADADKKSDGAAAQDADLFDALCEAGPDLGRRVRDRWIHDRMSKDDVEAEYQRQHSQRIAWRHRTDAGLAAITMAGDNATIDRLWGRIETAADAAYRADGGRDTATHNHRRSGDQRRFDAVVDLLENQTAGPGRGGRPAVVITVDAKALLSDSPAVAEQIGTGPIADELVVDALKTADLYTLLASPQGQPLWLGRSKPTASRAQLIALIIRDKGCIATGEHWQHTEAHHAQPRNAPVAGPTDITNLLLLSQTTHRDTHNNKITWYHNPTTNKWHNRPAKPNETPNQRPRRE